MKHELFLDPKPLFIENDQIQHFIPVSHSKIEFAECRSKMTISYSVKVEFFIYGILCPS